VARRLNLSLSSVALFGQGSPVMFTTEDALAGLLGPNSRLFRGGAISAAFQAVISREVLRLNEGLRMTVYGILSEK